MLRNQKRLSWEAAQRRQLLKWERLATSPASWWQRFSVSWIWTNPRRLPRNSPWHTLAGRFTTLEKTRLDYPVFTHWVFKTKTVWFCHWLVFRRMCISYPTFTYIYCIPYAIQCGWYIIAMSTTPFMIGSYSWISTILSSSAAELIAPQAINKRRRTKPRDAKVKSAIPRQCSNPAPGTAFPIEVLNE